LLLTLLCIFPALCPPMSYCADPGAGTAGGVFMKIPTGSPRAQALGNCGVSLVEGTEAITINPAGVAASQMREAAFAHMSWFQDYGGQYFAYVHPVGQSVIGMNYAAYSIEGFDARDSEGIPQYSQDIRVSHRYAALSFAKGFFMERLLLGVSAKGVWEDNYVTKYRSMVFDGGVALKPFRKLSLGHSFANSFTKHRQVVTISRTGGAFAFNPFLTTLLEYKKYSDRKGGFGGGVEFNLPEEMLQVGRVSIRTGYVQFSGGEKYGRNYDDKTLDTFGLNTVSSSGWTFGIGLFTAQAMGFGMSLDYTLVPYGALGKASQFMIKAQF